MIGLLCCWMARSLPNCSGQRQTSPSARNPAGVHRPPHLTKPHFVAFWRDFYRTSSSQELMAELREQQMVCHYVFPHLSTSSWKAGETRWESCKMFWRDGWQRSCLSALQPPVHLIRYRCVRIDVCSVCSSIWEKYLVGTNIGLLRIEGTVSLEGFSTQMLGCWLSVTNIYDLKNVRWPLGPIQMSDLMLWGGTLSPGLWGAGGWGVWRSRGWRGTARGMAQQGCSADNHCNMRPWARRAEAAEQACFQSDRNK